MNDHTLPLTKILMRNVNHAVAEGSSGSPYAIECTRQQLCASAKKFRNGIYTVVPDTLSNRYYFLHSHQVMLVVLEGQATLLVKGETQFVKVGDVIFLPPGPEYPFRFMNACDTLPFKYLVISAREKNERRGCPDSNKFLVESWLALHNGRCFEVVPHCVDNYDSQDCKASS